MKPIYLLLFSCGIGGLNGMEEKQFKFTKTPNTKHPLSKVQMHHHTNDEESHPCKFTCKSDKEIASHNCKFICKQNQLDEEDLTIIWKELAALSFKKSPEHKHQFKVNVRHSASSQETKE